MPQNTRTTGRMLSIQKINVGGRDVTPGGVDADGKDATYVVIRGASGNDVLVDAAGNIHSTVKISEFFSGDIYENEHSMADDSPYRFETSELLLRDVNIRISTHDALLGNAANQRYPKTASSAFGLQKFDVSKFYAKNKNAGQNTTINIFGTVL